MTNIRVKKILKALCKKMIAAACATMPSRMRGIAARAAQYTLHTLGANTTALHFPSCGRLSIAICLEGGMGDSIIALAWVKELHRHLIEKANIDVYGRGDFLQDITLMSSYIDTVFDHSLYELSSGYDLKLRLAHFVFVDHVNMPRIAEKNPKLEKYILAAHNFASLHGKYAGSRPEHDGAWASYCALQGWNRWDELGANGAIPFSRKTRGAFHLDPDAFSVLKKHSLDSRPFITVHAGGDTQLHTASQGVKVWPLEHWAQFCRLFKKTYPHIVLVQLGAGSHKPIEGADISLLGTATLRESAIVLKHALLHIDGESGLVHLRHQLGGRSLVLFGPTPEKYFGYGNNINIISPKCGNCMWLSGGEWFQNCARGFSRPECMWAILPEKVFEAASAVLAGRKDYSYSLHSPALYSSLEHTRYQGLLDDICAVCSLKKKPVSEHISGPGQSYIHASKQWEYPYAVEAVNGMGFAPLRIADIGGGRGALSWYLAQKGHSVTVYDINYLWDAGDNADVENQFFQFARGKGFEADFGSIFNIPAEDDAFDAVICISVVQHIPQKEYALKELLRVLKPGGKLVLSYNLVLHNPVQRDERRMEIFTPQMIRDALQKFGLMAEDIHPVRDVRASLADIVSDKVNIGQDMTVGGLVISKQLLVKGEDLRGEEVDYVGAGSEKNIPKNPLDKKN